MSSPPTQGALPGQDDPRFPALVEMIGRTGASSVQIRYSDDELPVVWMALAEYHGVYQVAADLNPFGAVYGLAESLLDGGQCTHCKRATGITLDVDTMPMAAFVCWYQYDPELRTFRRSCE